MIVLPFIHSTVLYKPAAYSLTSILLLGFVVTWLYGVIWAVDHFREFHVIKSLSLVVFCALFTAMTGTIIFVKRESLVSEINNI